MSENIKQRLRKEVFDSFAEGNISIETRDIQLREIDEMYPTRKRKTQPIEKPKDTLDEAFPKRKKKRTEPENLDQYFGSK